MTLSKIAQPELFKDQAYREIKKAIISFTIEPGAMLSERSLSDSLGISRTPLKLALQQLEVEGWVTSVPRKGIFVKDITETDVREVFELRRANEVLVVELLIPLLNEELLHTIELRYKELTNEQHDALKVVQLDSEFHLYLAELSKNRRLHQLIENLTDHFQWFGMAALRSGKSLEEINQEHGSIIQALKLRDLAQAKKAVLVHLNNTYRSISKNL
ncbi:GntR family transcriptional regulator [Sporosarcina sp. Te-1]|uniref:GntR family transcriptional regulator n=1 Tax=Sporosarcina sp. Te-1 TaxID=2818390 RepID=UPI001A9E2DF5|nr:GntR family transcriptional regulator [Sporosarcina sp. Te-1]QTD42965.1 GntR family transcriptional regulator [Sporosarcina sp. Te-1]